jgi:O-acetyl-ADP-ribose deacetylase (regulator of RNase III)
VDGAIHHKAGPQLRAECMTLGGCHTGEAKITLGYQLPSRYVIHTVGPIWHGGKNGESKLLADCYQSCFALAHANQLTTIAFPSISTGVYGYPIAEACRIALAQIEQASIQYPDLEKIMVVCFDQHTLETYQSALKERATNML